MTRIQLLQDETYAPGTWKRLRVGTVKSASINCPLCGEMGLLTDHTIKENGDVEPSVVCPNEECTFHEYVTLVGWNQGRQSTQEMKAIKFNGHNT